MSLSLSFTLGGGPHSHYCDVVDFLYNSGCTTFLIAVSGNRGYSKGQYFKIIDGADLAVQFFVIMKITKSRTMIEEGSSGVMKQE